MVNGTENHGNSLILSKILIRSFIDQIVMMLVLINMVLNMEHYYDSGKIIDGLTLQTLIVGFSGILDVDLDSSSSSDSE